MSVTYFNTRTGNTADYDQPNARLDALPNWVRLEAGQPLPAVDSDGVLSRPHLAVTNPVRVLNPPDGGPAIREDGTRDRDPRGEGGGDDLTTAVGEEPSQDATVEEWRAYAAVRATTPEDQADAAGMTRDELIAAYGSGSATPASGSRPPAKGATKAEWQDYARRQARDSDENDAIDGMTKEQLVDQYGPRGGS